MMQINAIAMPTNDTDYSCHIKAIESYGAISWQITPLVINSLGGRQTNTYAHAHTHCADKFVEIRCALAYLV